MKKLTVITAISALTMIGAYMSGCATIEKIASRSGAQIWGENCSRCHNSPSPDTFSDMEWEVAGMHMQIRGNLTEEEAQKVIAFLQSAN